MKIKEFIKEYTKIYPSKGFYNQFRDRVPPADRFSVATKQMIDSMEEKLGYRLPLSFQEFLMEFSNGILLLGWEPIGGVGEDSPCGKICTVNRIIPDVPEEVLIEETGELVESNRLISLTTFDGGESTNDHWVFICEDGIPNNEYRLGYIGQTCKSIVKVVDNFEAWLEIFWEGNKDPEQARPTFHVLYPDYDERGKILYEFLR